jgi:predicted acylesterase/phospholipase RssA
VLQSFGYRTTGVNALRTRSMYRLASVRLLSDLVEVMCGSVEVAPDGSHRPRLDDSLPADHALVRRAALASPSLYHSLDLGRSTLSYVRERPRTHLLLLCREQELDAPLEALAHVLAAAIATQFGEAAAAVTLWPDGPRASLWTGKEAARGLRAAGFDDLIAGLRATLDDTPLRAGQLHVVVAGSSPDLPFGFDLPRDDDRCTAAPRTGDQGYDRLLYLCREVPRTAPRSWLPLLAPAARFRDRDRGDPENVGPYFCSLIPSVVEPPPRDERLQTAPVDEELQLRRFEQPVRAGWRLARDRCLIPFDLGRMRRLWTEPGERAPSAVQAILADQRTREIAERWARAVTNRQVGVALSGGGASACRLIPILEGLQAAEVPIDVVSGVSGGALVGAYYCHDRRYGLRTLLEHRNRLQLMLALAVIDSWVVEWTVDHDLQKACIDETPVRFVPLATWLPESASPEARVVTRGTLGKAVRASGAAPLLVAPNSMAHGAGRATFSDGAISAVIPARILKDFGADIVFAWNCVAGPLSSNPFDGSLVGRFVYRHTPVGRLIDLWTSASFLLQRMSREAEEDAHYYFEPRSELVPLIESLQFVSADRIAERSRQSLEVARCIADCTTRWLEFRAGGSAGGEAAV